MQKYTAIYLSTYLHNCSNTASVLWGHSCAVTRPRAKGPVLDSMCLYSCINLSALELTVSFCILKEAKASDLMRHPSKLSPIVLSLFSVLDTAVDTLCNSLFCILASPLIRQRPQAWMGANIICKTHLSRLEC